MSHVSRCVLTQNDAAPKHATLDDVLDASCVLTQNDAAPKLVAVVGDVVAVAYLPRMTLLQN